MTEEPSDDAGRPGDDAGRTDAVVRHGDGERPRAGEEDLFAALDRTRADLAEAPVPPLPPDFAARMAAGLAAERARATAGTGPVPSVPPRAGASSRPPSRRPGTRADGHGDAGRRAGRRRALAYGLVALAAVAVVTGGLVAGTGSGMQDPAPTAAPPVPPAPAPASTPEPVSGADPVRALRAGLGARDPGPLADPARRAACLVAHGLPAGTEVLGSRQVLVDGRPGTLLVLPTGSAARFRVLVVGPGCTDAVPDTLADLTVGG
jgi:hypothetical protein